MFEGRPLLWLLEVIVETINGVLCVTKNFVHTLEVHVHVVITPEEATPAAFRVGFAGARGKVELWLRKTNSRSFPIRPEDAVET